MATTHAKLAHLDSGAEHLLWPRHAVGRAAICQLNLEDPRVSGLHAELVWTAQGWVLRDLGSRNGTYVDGARLSSGQQLALRRGAELAFAGQRFVLLADTPPPSSAVDEHGERRVATDGPLWLPSDEQPQLMIFRDLDGRWLAESSDGVRTLDEREAVLAGGRRWRLQLPELARATREHHDQLRLLELRLRLFVSRDQEHIALHLEHRGGVLELRPRAHNNLLLALARARIADAEDPKLPSSEQGWLYTDELASILDVEPELLHLWSHRARKQLADHGILDAAHLVERRPDTKQIRIGAWALDVEQA